MQYLIPADFFETCFISELCRESLTDGQCGGLHVQVHDVFAFAGKLFIKNIAANVIYNITVNILADSTLFADENQL